MANPSPSQTFTTEFGHEIEAERERWLSRRFLWYTGAVVVLNILSLLGTAIQFATSGGDKTAAPSGAEVGFAFGSGVFTLLLYGAAFWYVRRHPTPKVPPLRIVYWLIIISGVVQLLAGPILARQVVQRPEVRISSTSSISVSPSTPDEAPPPVTEEQAQGPAAKAPAATSPDDDPAKVKARQQALATAVAGGMGAFGLLGLHFFACLFLPWTPGESFKPLVPLLILNAVIIVGFMAHATITGVGSVRLAILGSVFILLSAFVALPGAAICWWRNSRFRDRFSNRMLRGRYLELRQELTNARTIHESLFPRPHTTGPLRFNYIYEPMRQIGGDYLYATFNNRDNGHKSLSIVLIDVTGHGIPAALTVNRLHGELERIFAENPEAGPGEVLRLLNSYVHLTLATHSVYVTAVCFRVHTDADTLDYASGGHPPAFIRTADGRVEQLDSTSFVLGACAGPDFHPAEKSIPFHRGDTLIAYTDGALEARDKHGRFLGVAGMLRIIAMTTDQRSRDPAGAASGSGGITPDIATDILKAVERHRHGPTEDDTLIIEVTRAIEAAPESPRKAAILSRPAHS